MAKNNFQEKVITGAEAVSEAMRQINPDVVAAYPITPQTHIVEKYSEFVADGEVNTEFVPVESEHSALSCVIGAQAAGARSMTATSSQGLAYMWEVLGVASGMRLPILMPVVNRALSAPINIHCDHSDAMGASSQGWIQIFCENNQEVYETVILMMRVIENKEILLPAMVMMDGFVTSHNAEKVKIFNDKEIKKFIGEYSPHQPLLDFDNPVSYGPIVLPDYQMEIKRQQIEAINNVFINYKQAAQELSIITKNKYPLFELYKTNDANAVIIVSSSTAGSVKHVVDGMRQKGKKVGMIKIRLFRPFPYDEIFNAIKDIKKIAVLDRSASYGGTASFYQEVMTAFAQNNKKTNIQSYIFGLGGREIELTHIEEVFNQLLSGNLSKQPKYIGLDE